MTRQRKTARDDDKAFVVLTISRNEVRDMCGDAAADRLSNRDMRQLADELSEYCFDDNFVEALQQVITTKFSDSSEDAED